MNYYVHVLGQRTRINELRLPSGCAAPLNWVSAPIFSGRISRTVLPPILKLLRTANGLRDIRG